jgi:protein-disulfide isomerase
MEQAASTNQPMEKNIKMQRFLIGIAVSLAFLSHSTPAKAQFAGTATRDDFRDTTVLRPPAGSKVALIVFEDLGCPACARAHPFELQTVEQTHVKLLRYDFPLEAHVWTFEGAVVARYIQDKIDPKLADQFRSDVFASQRFISNKDDLYQFTSDWLKKHGKQMPAKMDPDGALAKKVSADYELGKRLNVEFTPTVVVVTRDQYQAVCGTHDGQCDPTKIVDVVKGAMAQAK